MNDLRSAQPRTLAAKARDRSFSARAGALGSVRDEAWIVTDGSVGMEAQGIAVAEAVGLPFRLKRVQTEGIARFVPARLQIYLPPAALLRFVESNEKLQAPWPLLVISIGRRSVPIALAIKQVAGAFGLHIQDPKVPPTRFDLVAAHRHDGLAGPNVITTFGAPHSVTPERLEQAMPRFAAEIEGLPHPRIAVLLGGDSKAYTFPADVARALGRELAALCKREHASLLVTPSRRTSKESLKALREEVKDLPGMFWDGEGDNPYFAFLAYADAIVVTQDSVNMITEAAGTGKPLYVKMLPGYSRRQSRFHAEMQAAGIVRPFDGTLATWTYTPLNDTELVAGPIRDALGLARKASGA